MITLLNQIFIFPVIYKNFNKISNKYISNKFEIKLEIFQII